MDSDDNLINTNKLSELLNILNKTKSDVISFKYIRTQGDKNVISSVRNKLINNIKPKELLTNYSVNHTHNIPIINYVWNKIIRISILKQIPWYKVPNEDNLFSGILHSIGSLEFYNEYLYSYNERNNSISKSNNFSLDIVNKSIILLNNISKDKCKYYDEIVTSLLFVILIDIHLLDPSNIKFIKKIFKQYKNNAFLKWRFSYDLRHKFLFFLFKINMFTIILLILKARSKNNESDII